MIWVYWSVGLAALFYVFAIYSFLYHWQQTPVWCPPAAWSPEATRLTVIIPARNEAENIKACLFSIIQQDYPSTLYEIIVVDDHSTDETAAIVAAFRHPNVKLLSLSDYDLKTTNSYKKAAIELAIANAMGDFIVTTDADCIAPSRWLSHLVSFHELTGKGFIAAPVVFRSDGRLVEQFQALDYAGMMLMTGAGIQGGYLSMSNGANLAYTKALFYGVDGFAGIRHLASGDDLLLVQKIMERYPETMGFVKSRAATVKSIPQRDWHSFLMQRLRWAGKSAAYTDWVLLLIQVVVFFTCVAIIGLLVLAPLVGMPFVLLGIGLLLVKTVGDYLLLRKAAAFFGQSHLMRIFPAAELIHTIYIAVVGGASLFVKKYEWKGRKVQ